MGLSLAPHCMLDCRRTVDWLWEATDVRELHFHLGPHKTGSTSIQNFLKDHIAVNLDSAQRELFVTHPIVTELSESLRSKNWDASLEAASKLRQELLTSSAQTVIVSNEDLSGNLLGRKGTRRVYPRLLENLKLLDDVFGSSFRCKYYFFERPEDDWLRSVYYQNLKYRSSTSDFEEFMKGIRGERLWSVVLNKTIKRFGDRFVILPYSCRTESSVVKTFISTVLPDLQIDDSVYKKYWLNKAPDVKAVRALEIINGSHSSRFAKRNARKFVAETCEAPLKNTGVSKRYYLVLSPGSKQFRKKWPRVSRRPHDFPSELGPLWNRSDARIHSQHQPNLLPALSVELSVSRIDITDSEDNSPGGLRQDMRQQEKILRHRFRGLPLVCFYNGLSISYLRRSTAHTEHARDVFFSLWESEYQILLATLPTRWLISTLQTFMDHGNSEAQRTVGTAGYFFANTLKAYEAERAFENVKPDAVYKSTKPNTPNGFPGLDRFELGNTDLMLNTLALLLELSARDEHSGRVLREFLLRTQAAHTLFSRMDQNRLHHDVHVKGFENCWSFFEKPSGKNNS